MADRENLNIEVHTCLGCSHLCMWTVMSTFERNKMRPALIGKTGAAALHPKRREQSPLSKDVSTQKQD